MEVRNFASDKILHHLNEVCSWVNGGNPFAITTEMNLTDKCNHKCICCAGGRVEGQDELTDAEIANVIYQLKKEGCKGITFTGGGEPMLHPSFMEAVIAAHTVGLDVGIITNGSLLHKVDTERLLECSTWIRISLDAGTADMHKKTHGVNDFDKIIDNISRLVAAKVAAGPAYNCTIGTAYLTGRGTSGENDMLEFIEMSTGLGVDYAQFRPYLTMPGKEDLAEYNPIDYDTLAELETPTTRVLCSKHKYDAMVEGRVVRNYDKCYGQQFAAIICANGDLTICCHTKGVPEMVIGNIRNNTIREIWDSDKRREVVESIDIDKCTLLCRGHSFNTILWDIKQEREHVNFL